VKPVESRQAGEAPKPCDGVDISGLFRGQAGLDVAFLRTLEDRAVAPFSK
jgi:hypothetical protein